MANLDSAIQNIHQMEDMAKENQFFCRIHPLAKVLVTLWYLVLVMSFDKYNLTGLAGMGLYLIILCIIGEVSVKIAFRRLRLLLFGIFLLGSANLIFDREVLYHLKGFAVTGGMLSMLTLFLKAGFAILAAYLLMAGTTMTGICYALRLIHVPGILVTLMMLIYRYLVLMLKEAARMQQAYVLRAPGQKGVHIRVWGSFAGQMLLRSMEHAEQVFDSMTLRGFHGEFPLLAQQWKICQSILYTGIWVAFLLILRIFPVFEMVGGLL